MNPDVLWGAAASRAVAEGGRGAGQRGAERSGRRQRSRRQPSSRITAVVNGAGGGVCVCVRQGAGNQNEQPGSWTKHHSAVHGALEKGRGQKREETSPRRPRAEVKNPSAQFNSF